MARDVAGGEPPIEVRRGWRPGALGRLVELHGDWYARHWRMPRVFEALVARGLADFSDSYDERRGDGLWLAVRGERVVGGVAIVGPARAAPAALDAAGREAPARFDATLGSARDPRLHRLRWFILDDAAQGLGAGSAMMREAMDSVAGRPVFLTTFAGLDAARALYERHGFVLTHEAADDSLGLALREQRFDRHG